MDPHALCVFCGSRVGNDPTYAAAATRLGTLLAEAGITLVYGGGRIGLMGVIADSVTAAGGRVVGVIPDFLERREVANRAADQLIVSRSMHERKQRMFELADGFVVLPGGIGTLDETIEILTWKQLHRHTKPIVLLDLDGFWQPLLALFDAVIRRGFATDRTRSLYEVVDTTDAIIPAIRRALAPSRGPSTGL